MLVKFVWMGVNQAGEIQRGLIEAPDISVAYHILESEGWHIRQLRKKPFISVQRLNRLPPYAITLMTRQWATLIKAEIPLISSLILMAQMTKNKAMKALLETIIERVQKGTKLHIILSQYPQYFDALYCSLIHIGEETARLASLLEQIAIYREHSERIKKKFKKTLFYPFIVLMLTLIVAFVFLTKIVPQFESLFQNFNAPLPVFTKIILHMARRLDYWVYTLIGMISCMAAFLFLKNRYSFFLYRWDRIKLYFPFWGTLIKSANLARACRTLAITFTAGIPILESFNLVRETVHYSLYKKAWEHLSYNIARGESLYQGLAANPLLFSPFIVQMVKLGEETGKLEAVFNRIAIFYEEEIETQIHLFNQWLEPCVMLWVGGVVGTLVIALYLPIFKLGSVM